MPLPPRREFSEATAEAIDDEVRRLLDEARVRVNEALIARRHVLDELARLLMEHEVVEGDTLRQLLRTDLHSCQDRELAGAPALTTVGAS